MTVDFKHGSQKNKIPNFEIGRKKLWWENDTHRHNIFQNFYFLDMITLISQRLFHLNQWKSTNETYQSRPCSRGI